MLEFFKSDLFIIIAGAVLLLLEYFLGRTDLVKAGSTLELVLNALKKLLEPFKGKPGVEPKKPE